MSENSINKITFLGLSYFKLLFWFHIIAVFGFLIYIGLKRDKVPIWVYYLMIVLGVIIIIYHIYRLVTKGLYYPLWNYLHVIIFAPLLIYIGFKQRKTSGIYYDLLLALAFGALGINIYYLYRSR